MRSENPSRVRPAAQTLRLLMMGSLFAVAACGGKGAPSGQTVATVNGEDITASELNFELATAGVAPQMRKQAQPLALQALIERKLLAQVATKQDLDKDPEFVLGERRAREIMLAQKAGQVAASTGRRPQTESDINDYLDKNPGLGRERRILIIDQLRFATPSNRTQLEAMRPAKSLDELSAILQRQGAAVERAQVDLDTATMDAETLSKLTKVQGGEPLVVMRGPLAVANVVVGTRPAPSGAMDSAALAKQRLAVEQAQTSAKQQQESLRRAATIVYADGYAPKPAAGAPAAK